MAKHILVLFCDQLRHDCISALGDANIKTPAFDSIVRDSVVFDRCITPSPVCVPARLSLMSGQYCARHGNNNNNLSKKYSGKGFYAMLTESGYNSCCVGKMHNAWDMYAPIGFGCRHTQEELSDNDDDYTAYIRENYPYVFDYNGHRSEMYYMPQISQLPPHAHPTQWIGDKSVEFLRGADPEQNTFLFASFIHPHPPFCPPAPWNKLYRTEANKPFVPENWRELSELAAPAFACEALGISETDILKLRNFYYACVSFVDYQVGRIIEVLKEKGMYDDTLILIASDHGEMLGDYRNMGKRSMLDGAAKIPFAMKVPKHAPQVRKDIVSLVDVAPTLLSYAGVEYDRAEFDGVDVFSESHEEVYSQYSGGKSGVYMIATSEDKLIYDKKADKYYYFDSFPEVHNKYDEACDTVRVKSLRAKLIDHIDSDVYEPVPAPKKKKINPFGVGRVDHVVRHEEELATVPPQYNIDLEMAIAEREV